MSAWNQFIWILHSKQTNEIVGFIIEMEINWENIGNKMLWIKSKSAFRFIKFIQKRKIQMKTFNLWIDEKYFILFNRMLYMRCSLNWTVYIYTGYKDVGEYIRASFVNIPFSLVLFSYHCAIKVFDERKTWLDVKENKLRSRSFRGVF